MPCLRCGRPIGRGTWCPDHAPVRHRPTTAQRGYGSRHERRAAALRAERRDCCLCGQPIDYQAHHLAPASFTAHHLTSDKDGPIDAAHRACNIVAGPPRF